jgi:hypothetical protein
VSHTEVGKQYARKTNQGAQARASSLFESTIVIQLKYEVVGSQQSALRTYDNLAREYEDGRTSEAGTRLLPLYSVGMLARKEERRLDAE